MWFYGNLDPTDWFVYVLFAAVTYAFIGYRWQFLLVLVGGLLLWPYVIRGARFLWRFSRTHRSRKPGVLYCADCGGELGPGPQDYFAASLSCPSCNGMWCSQEQLQEGLAKRKSKASRPWIPFPQAKEKTKPCPKCAQPLPPGSFSGVTSVTYYCQSCNGYWSNRAGWLALELWLN